MRRGPSFKETQREEAWCPAKRRERTGAFGGKEEDAISKRRDAEVEAE